MEWDHIKEDLLTLMVGLYPTAALAAQVATRANLPAGYIDLSGPPMVFWMSILREADLRGRMHDLIDVAHKDYPSVDFPKLTRQKDAKRAAGPLIEDKDWKGPKQVDEGLEKVIGKQPTFLPISFFQTGLERSRSVVKMTGPGGSGSGFLVEGDVLITNHHVLPDATTAGNSKILCNFQKTANDLDAEAEELGLDPAALFKTSPVTGGDDWTAVKVEGTPTARWGALELVDTTIEVQGYVNIIQHPAGLPKQVALYHNLVTYADDDRVQYLTDTLPGSSGSPVFDSSWRVVALHHSGGWLAEPGTKSVYFRNEGIHVRALRRGLIAAGVIPA
jgi:V8-like Glu-specific endopeptidase